MATNCYLDTDETGPAVDRTKYRGMIGSLLYLTTSRPDIMHSVCMHPISVMPQRISPNYC